MGVKHGAIAVVTFVVIDAGHPAIRAEIKAEPIASAYFVKRVLEVRVGDPGAAHQQAAHALAIVRQDLAIVVDQEQFDERHRAPLFGAQPEPFIAVQGDVLKDISLLERVGFVMKDGKVYKNTWRK